MNTKKIFTTSLVVLTGMMVAAIAAYFLLTTLGYTKGRSQEAVLPPVTSVLIGGMVQNIMATSTASTTGTLFTVKTANGEIKTILISQDVAQCSAAANIASLERIAVGDELAVRGEMVAGGAVQPCHDVTHYLKLIKEPPVQTASSTSPSGATTTDTVQEINPTNTIPPGPKLKAANFTGTLEKIDTGCFSDGECFAVIDGKHVTVLRGWSRETVGSVQGVEGFGDLESHIGQTVEAYVHDLGDGTYTLYGSEGFYLKLIK